MGKSMITLGILATFTLLSCGNDAPAKKKSRPLSFTKVISLDRTENTYSGTVAASQFSDLAFKMSGLIVKMNVKEGQRVKKGDIVAEIDPSDYRLDLESKTATFKKAEMQMERARKLLEKDAISRQEYESTEAAFTNARLSEENARNILDDTRLQAPFDGFIQKKYVENYQRVQPGEGVVCLVNPDLLQIVFTIPETGVKQLTPTAKIEVEFDAYKGKRFECKVSEFVEASPDGAGLPVYLNIVDPAFSLDKYHIAVGFSCKVIISTTNPEMVGKIAVPISAVVYDNAKSAKTVFVYDPHTRKLQQRTITDHGMIAGRDLLIVEGDLHAGEQVVSAGAQYIK